MIVEAVYKNGQLRFLQPIALRGEQVRVMVEIPDEAIEGRDPYAGLDEHSLRLVAALDAIRNAPTPMIETDDISEKAAERLAAFGLRKDI